MVVIGKTLSLEFRFFFKLLLSKFAFHYNSHAIPILLQCGKVKMYCDIPFLLPKSYSTLDTDESAASNCTSLVDCQVRRP